MITLFEEVSRQSPEKMMLNGHHHWEMDTVRLKMNESKTELMLLESRQHLMKCTTESLEALGDNIKKSEVIRYLGGYLDSTPTFKQHIKTKYKSAMLKLLKIISIRKYLDKETVTQLTVSLWLSHLDYTNGLLIRLPHCSIKLMQKVQNMAAKVVLNLKKHDSSTDAIKTFHWLPIRQQIEYKVIDLTQQCIHGQAPNYLKSCGNTQTTSSRTTIIIYNSQMGSESQIH